jgi:hypothetical protein
MMLKSNGGNSEDKPGSASKSRTASAPSRRASYVEEDDGDDGWALSEVEDEENDQDDDGDDRGSTGRADGDGRWGVMEGGKKYRAREDETCQRIAHNLGIDINELVAVNRAK